MILISLATTLQVDIYCILNKLPLIFMLLPVFVSSQLSHEQVRKIDSLQRVIKNAKHDSTIIRAWEIWDGIIYLTDADLDFKLNTRIDSLCSVNLIQKVSEQEKNLLLKAQSTSLNNIGLIYYDQGNYSKSIEYLTKSLVIKEKIKDKYGIAASYNNIGNIYYRQGIYSKTIDYYTRSLKIQEELGNKQGIASAYHNIGLIYKEQNDYSNELEYYTKSLKIYTEIDDKKGIASSLNSIGVNYTIQQEYYNAIDYYTRSLKIREEIGDKKGVSISLHNLGIVYNELGEYTKANDFYSKSLKIREDLNDQNGIASSLTSIAVNYNSQENYKKAFEYGNRSLLIAKEIGATIRIKDASKLLWEVSKKKGDYTTALTMYELFISTKDSIESEENQKAVIRYEYKVEYEKKSAADSIKSAENQKIIDAKLAAEKAENKQHKLEAKHQKQQAYFLYGGLGLAILFGGFIFNRFRVTRKQKVVIEQQKEKVDEAFEELEEKNQEILDSIKYAKRIQNAILPPTKVVKEYLQDSFILYKPKDIVAGDFYWLEHKDGKVLFAAADCTGHGVPGAMVSVVCNNGLNRSVREYGITEPGKILDKTREIVIQEFEKSEEEVKDGMDIALCTLNGKKLQYAGAHNPLWIIRNGEVLETKANKQPIGKFDKQTAYTTHSFDLETGDAIYIFSDGYVDQFGGEKGKKFKSKAFKELLLSMQQKSMEDQRMLINQAFENWRGDLEQIDDICVIGVRI